MHSQHNEEKWIVDYFGSFVGSFLDIGAYDGVTFSNTKKLVELGWSGVCVEPSPNAFVNLFNVYKDNSKIKLLNCAITSNSSLIKFYDSGGDAVSTLVLDHKVKWEKGSEVLFKEIYIKTLSMKELFEFSGYDFDFINIDVEGMNFELFSILPFNKLKNLKAVCVEYENRKQQKIDLAKSFGFKEMMCNAENLFFARE